MLIKNEIEKVFLLAKYHVKGNQIEKDTWINGYYPPLDNFFFLIKKPKITIKNGKFVSLGDRVSLHYTDDKGVLCDLDSSLQRTKVTTGFKGIKTNYKMLSINYDDIKNIYFAAELNSEADSKPVLEHFNNLLKEIFDDNEHLALSGSSKPIKAIYENNESVPEDKRSKNNLIFKGPYEKGESSKFQEEYNNWFAETISGKGKVRAIVIPRMRAVLCVGSNLLLKSSLASVIKKDGTSLGKSSQNIFNEVDGFEYDKRERDFHNSIIDTIESKTLNKPITKSSSKSELAAPKILVADVRISPFEIDSGDSVINVNFDEVDKLTLKRDHNLHPELQAKGMYNYATYIDFSHRTLEGDFAIVNCDPVTLESSILSSHHEIFARKRELLNLSIAQANLSNGNLVMAMQRTFESMGHKDFNVSDYVTKNLALLTELSIMKGHIGGLYGGLTTSSKLSGILSVSYIAKKTLQGNIDEKYFDAGITAIAAGSVYSKVKSAFDKMNQAASMAEKADTTGFLKHYLADARGQSFIQKFTNNISSWTPQDQLGFMECFEKGSLIKKSGLSKEFINKAAKGMKLVESINSVLTVLRLADMLRSWVKHNKNIDALITELSNKIDTLEDEFVKVGISKDTDKKELLRSLTSSRDRDIQLDQLHHFLRQAQLKKDKNTNSTIYTSIGLACAGLSAIFPPAAIGFTAIDLITDISIWSWSSIVNTYNYCIYAEEANLVKEFNDYTNTLSYGDKVTFEKLKECLKDDREMNQPLTQFYYRRHVISGFLHILLRASTKSITRSPASGKTEFVEGKMEKIQAKLDEYKVEDYLNYYIYEKGEDDVVLIPDCDNLGERWVSLIQWNKTHDKDYSKNYDPKRPLGKLSHSDTFVQKSNKFSNVGIHKVETKTHKMSAVIDELELFQLPLEEEDIELRTLYVYDRDSMNFNIDIPTLDKSKWLTWEKFIRKYGSPTPLDPVRVFIALKESKNIKGEDYLIKGLYRYNLQLINLSNFPDCDGPLYKGILKTLEEGDLLNDEKDFKGRLGAIVNLDYFFGNKNIYGLRPFSSSSNLRKLYGEELEYKINLNIKISGQKSVSSDIEVIEIERHGEKICAIHDSNTNVINYKFDSPKDKNDKPLVNINGLFNEAFLRNPLFDKSRQNLELLSNCTSLVFAKIGSGSAKDSCFYGSVKLNKNLKKLPMPLIHSKPEIIRSTWDFPEVPGDLLDQPITLYFVYYGKLNKEDYDNAKLRYDSIPINFDYGTEEAKASINFSTSLHYVGEMKNFKISSHKDKERQEDIKLINEVLPDANVWGDSDSKSGDCYIGKISLSFKDLKMNRFNHIRPVFDSFDDAMKKNMFHLSIKNIRTPGISTKPRDEVKLCHVKFSNLSQWINSDLLPGSDKNFVLSSAEADEYVKKVTDMNFLPGGDSFEEASKQIVKEGQMTKAIDNWLQGK